METFFIADTHFNHDREFIYRVRGFNNIQDMNNTIINNWNNAISCNDQVYFLGDFFLGKTNCVSALVMEPKRERSRNTAEKHCSP